MILNAYQTLGGAHPETTAVKNILAFHDVTAPHTGKPFSEAMLLGIGGGLGSMYILWEFERHGYPSIVLGFTYRTNYPVEFLQGLCARLGGGEHRFETAGKVKAEALLEEILAGGDPAIAWVDLGGEPHYFHYLLAGVVVVYGIEGDKVLVDACARRPYRIPKDVMTAARAKVPSFRNRLMVIKPPGPVDLETSVIAGIRDCVAYLGASSTSFALPAIRKWSRLMTDEKNAKGWPVVFKNGRGLYGTLRTVYEAVEIFSPGALRGLYADFLEEAASFLKNDSLRIAADAYRDLHNRWRALAAAALPAGVAEFDETRDMLNRRAAIHLREGSDGLEAIAPLNDALHALKGRLNDSFPLSQSDTTSLFADLSSRLAEIHKAEQSARTALAESLNR